MTLTPQNHSDKWADLPSAATTVPTACDAVAWRLLSAGFKLLVTDRATGRDATKEVLCRPTKNVFIDVIPAEYFDNDGVFVRDEDVHFILLQGEPAGTALPRRNIPGMINSVVRVQVYGGYRPLVRNNAVRLYHFFSQSDRQGWDVDANGDLCGRGLRVTNVQVLGEPSLAGAENAGVSAYAFRMGLQTLRTDLPR